MNDRRSVARFLAACALGDDQRALRLAANLRHPERLPTVAAAHGVTGSLHRFLDASAEAAVPVEVRRSVAGADLANRAMHRVVGADLALLRRLLDGAGIPWAVVKGPAVAHGLYPVPATRTFGDIDLLVAPTDFASAVEALEHDGHRLSERNWSFLRRVRAGEVLVQLRSGTAVDLHWHLLFGADERERFSIDTAALLGRSVTFRHDDLVLPTLDAVDTLLHLCLHDAKEGGDRLAWMVDVHWAVVRGGPSWPDVVARAQEWGVALPVGTVLARAAAAVGTAVPVGVIDQLLPRWWAVVMADLERLWPTGGSTRQVELGGVRSLLARSAFEAGDVGGARRRALVGVVRRGSGLLLERRLRRQPRQRGAEHPDGLAYEAGGEGERNAYFREVTLSDRREEPGR